MSKKKNKIKKEVKPDLNSGLFVASGEITSSDYDEKTWTELQKEYWNMSNGCPIITATLNLIKYPILSAGHRIQVGSDSDKAKQATDYIEWCLSNIYKGFDYFLRHKLQAIELGCSFSEKLIKQGDEYRYFEGEKEFKKITNRVIRYNSIKNETISKIYYNETMDWVGVQHQKRIPEKGCEYIDILERGNDSLVSGERSIFIKNINDKISVYSFNELDGDIRGNSILRPVRFYYDAANKIMTSKVIGIQRGAGIPIIYTKGNLQDQKAKIKEIGETICQMSKGWASMDETKMRVVLEEPKSQSDIMPFLEFINRAKFYNTMSQFATAGLGANGSRASTDAHKSPYEIAINYWASDVSNYIQQEIDYMIDNSFLAGISDEDYPVFEFNNIGQADLLKTANIFKTLFDAGLKIDERDWNIIRDQIGLPEKDIEIVDKNTAPTEEVENIQQGNKQLSAKVIERKVSLEVLNFERDVFELESANEHFETIQEKAQIIIDKHNKNLFDNIRTQLKANRKARINIDSEKDLINELTALYINAKEKGNKDVIKEVSKLKKNVELSITTGDKKEFQNNIGRLVKKYYRNIRTSLENVMNRLTDTALDKKGGIDYYLLQYENGFKTEKRALITETEAGYTDGRGETLDELQDKIDLYLYTSVLAASTCEECAPMDGFIGTMEELESAGIQTHQPVNANCLGGDHCHCQVAAWRLN